MRMHWSDPGGLEHVVFLNGVLLKLCIWADEEAGEAEIFATDADGNFIRDGDGVKTERVFGKIEIRPGRLIDHA